MADMVDAYQKWLGIPSEEQPPSHYRLLGLELFESDRPTIDVAAKRLMGSLQKQLAGPEQASIRKLLEEISDARRCLLLGDRKAAYDQRIRTALEAIAEPELIEPPEAEPIDIEPIAAMDAPLVEPIEPQPIARPVVVTPAEEIVAAVPIPDEAVPEAEPLPPEEFDAAPEPELLDEQDVPEVEPLDELDDAPEAEPFDEIEEPTTLEQPVEPPKAPPVAPPKPAVSESPALRKAASPQPAAPAPPAAPPKPALKPQPIAAAARTSAAAAPAQKAAQKPAATVEPAESHPWLDSDHAVNGSDIHGSDIHGSEAQRDHGDSGGIDGSFFFGMGLSSVRAGGAPSSAFADSVAGASPAGGKTAANAKNSKSTSAKTKSKTSAGGKSPAESQSEGNAAVKKAPQRGPQMWQIMVGVGGAVVILILVVAAMSGGDPSTKPTAQPRATTAKGDVQRIQFGPHTVTGPINDRTTRSPVTGAPVKVPVERHGDLMFVDVKINDQDAGKFLLDTGTADLIISTAVADKLKLPPPQSPHSKIMKMPGGNQSVTQRKIDSLGMGMVRFEEGMIEPEPTNDEWLAMAVDIKPWADAVGVPISGVIGGEVWSQVPFSIDPVNNVVTFFKKGRFPYSAGKKPEFLTRFDNFRKPALSASLDNRPEGTFVIATGVPDGLMVKDSAEPVKSLSIFGQEISDPPTVESKNGDGYYDPNEIRQSGVIGAGILSHYLLMFDYEHESFMAVPIKK
jgi:hypothetical protein